jgi:hypothetical protein
MAAHAYYSAKPCTSQEQDQQHLISPNMSSLGFSSGQPSPLKPLHPLSLDQSPEYHHGPVYDDFENLKEAEIEDSVQYPCKKKENQIK